METLDRPALMRKTPAELRHVLRRMGADSPMTETKESIINRILLFQPQKWKSEEKIVRKSLSPLSEEEVRELLMPYILRGLKLEVKDGCWFVKIGERQDSGSLSMPPSTIERSVKYLIPKDIL